MRRSVTVLSGPECMFDYWPLVRNDAVYFAGRGPWPAIIYIAMVQRMLRTAWPGHEETRAAWSS